VARSPFDLGQLVIRGAQPGESGAFLLGMQLPQAFHFGGLTSTFNSFLLERFDLIPSNFSSRYGRFVGGVVDLMPREGKRDRIHGDLKIDVWDAHVIVEGPIKEGSFALSLRRSFVGEIVGPFLGSDSLVVAPRYYDYTAMLDYPVARGKLKLMIFGSDDALELIYKNAPENDSSLRGQFSTRQWFHMLFASYQRSTGRVDWEATLSAGPQHADAAIGQAARFNLDLIEADLRLEARVRLSRKNRLAVGLDVQTDYFWVNVDAPRPMTEEKVQGPIAPEQHQTLDNHGYEGAPALYAQGEVWLAERLALFPGVRVDWFVHDQHTYVQPRLMARLRVAQGTWLKAGAGLYHQPPQPPYGDRVLGNPAIHAEQAWHFTVGVESRPIPRWPALRVELNLFYKDLRNLAVSSGNYLVRDGRVVPEVYSDEGIGRVYGGDLLIKHDSPRFVYGWIAYTLLKSERQDHSGLPWRPFQYDQTHILTIVAGYHLPWEVDLGLRFRYVTGNPDTPLLAGVFDADKDVYTPIPGAPFSSRLPDFIQLDARIDKRFAFKSWILAIYIDVTNVTNQSNVEGYQYSYDYRARRAVNSLPILPSLGIRASF
jgi:outer membrane receptor protein involved in Fe transport